MALPAALGAAIGGFTGVTRSLTSSLGKVSQSLGNLTSVTGLASAALKAVIDPLGSAKAAFISFAESARSAVPDRGQSYSQANSLFNAVTNSPAAPALALLTAGIATVAELLQGTMKQVLVGTVEAFKALMPVMATSIDILIAFTKSIMGIAIPVIVGLSEGLAQMADDLTPATDALIDSMDKLKPAFASVSSNLLSFSSGLFTAYGALLKLVPQGARVETSRRDPKTGEVVTTKDGRGRRPSTSNVLDKLMENLKATLASYGRGLSGGGGRGDTGYSGSASAAAVFEKAQNAAVQQTTFEAKTIGWQGQVLGLLSDLVKDGKPKPSEYEGL